MLPVLFLEFHKPVVRVLVEMQIVPFPGFAGFCEMLDYIINRKRQVFWVITETRNNKDCPRQDEKQDNRTVKTIKKKGDKTKNNHGKGVRI